MDPDVDFAGLMEPPDGNSGKSTPGIENIVISRTLKQADYPGSVLRPIPNVW